MNRAIRILVSIVGEILLGAILLFGQVSVHVGAAPTFHGGNVPPSMGFSPGFGFSGPFVQSYFYPAPNWYGGYYSPFLNLPSLSPSYAYMPSYWWVSPYLLADPRQDAYNPSGGYPKETVTTLLLATYPVKSQVTIDGILVGTSDALGPFQLPVGEHTLRVEAPGYEPSETVLKVEQPTLQQLEIRLTRKGEPAKPAPQS